MPTKQEPSPESRQDTISRMNDTLIDSWSKCCRYFVTSVYQGIFSNSEDLVQFRLTIIFR